jgi:hypothetical protein
MAKKERVSRRAHLLRKLGSYDCPQYFSTPLVQA